jgi:hypothetical protein
MAIKKFNAVAGISVGDDNIVDVINSVGNVTANNLSITNVTTIDNVANLKIAGGSSGYVLKTDGASNLTWGLDSAAPGGNTTEVQINSGGSFSGNDTFTFDGSTVATPNISATGNISATYFLGNGSQLTGVAASSSASANTVTDAAQPNITSLGTLTELEVSGPVNLGDASNISIAGGANGYLLSTDGNGDVSWQNKNFLVTSNITNLVSGSALEIVLDSANLTYPGGIFTLVQLGPVSLGTTDIWASGAASKNAYSNFVAGTVNTQNVSITLGLANATFQIQTSDSITIGSSVITGANLVSLGITSNGTYTIPSSYFSSAIQIATSSPVSANLTSSRGVFTSTGVTLTTLQPVPFSVNSLSGSFASSSVPYWNLNQTFNWSASMSAGATVASGNIAYANTALSVSGILTSTGTTSGTSPSVNSTYAYTVTTSDFTGEGRYGAGTRTIPSTVTGTVNAATKYYPLFYKTTSSSANPTFTTGDTYNANNFATGQGANTTATTTNYLWIATPNSTPHTFAFTFLGSQVSVTPDVTYSSQTISAQTYNVYGFTNYSAITFIYTTS